MGDRRPLPADERSKAIRGREHFVGVPVSKKTECIGFMEPVMGPSHIGDVTDTPDLR